MITTIYRCHEINKSTFNSLLAKYLNQSINHKNHNIIGDINIYILYCNNDVTDIESLYCILIEFSSNNNKATCIDHAFVKNRVLKQIEFFYIKQPITDPYTQIININTKFCKVKEKVDSIDYNKRKDLSKNVEWREIYTNKDVHRQ